MSIAQQIGANILDLKAGVDGALASLAKTLPAGIRISRVYDLAEFVEESIASVRDAILIGGVLAIVVLLVFLRDWRLTMIAAVTLPMAVIPTFVFMWLFGGTINLMSMGGLAVAIGLVIDDAVVVVENIHRRAGEGGSSVVDAVAAADGAARQLDADDGGRLRAARPAVRRAGPVLPRAVAEPLGRGADLAGAVDQRRAADGALGGDAPSPDGRIARTRRSRLRAAARRDGRRPVVAVVAAVVLARR